MRRLPVNGGYYLIYTQTSCTTQESQYGHATEHSYPWWVRILGRRANACFCHLSYGNRASTIVHHTITSILHSLWAWFFTSRVSVPLRGFWPFIADCNPCCATSTRFTKTFVSNDMAPVDTCWSKLERGCLQFVSIVTNLSTELQVSNAFTKMKVNVPLWTK